VHAVHVVHVVPVVRVVYAVYVVRVVLVFGGVEVRCGVGSAAGVWFAPMLLLQPLDLGMGGKAKRVLVVANYLVDSLPADAYRVRDGLLHVGSVTTTLTPNVVDAVVAAAASVTPVALQTGVSAGTQLPLAALDGLQRLQVRGVQFLEARVPAGTRVSMCVHALTCTRVHVFVCVCAHMRVRLCTYPPVRSGAWRASKS
jgi:hypothetical protein